MTAEVVEALTKEFKEHQKKPERACRSALSEIGFLLRGLVSEMANAVEPVEKEILEDMMADALQAQQRLMAVERMFTHREKQREYWDKNPHVLMQFVEEEEDEDEGAPGVH